MKIIYSPRAKLLYVHHYSKSNYSSVALSLQNIKLTSGDCSMDYDKKVWSGCGCVVIFTVYGIQMPWLMYPCPALMDPVVWSFGCHVCIVKGNHANMFYFTITVLHKDCTSKLIPIPTKVHWSCFILPN